MPVTTRRQSGLPLTTAAVTRSQASRGMHGPSKTAPVVNGDSCRDRGQVTGSTVGTPIQRRRNDPRDEGESYVDQGRSNGVQYHGIQRNVAVGPGFERVSIDRTERVPREGPAGEVESSLVAAPTIPIPKSEPPLCPAPPWLQEPPESWYQYTPHFSRTVARLLYWGLEEEKEGKPLKVYSLFKSAHHHKDIPPNLHSQHVGFISRMGERISGSRGFLQNYQTISRRC